MSSAAMAAQVRLEQARLHSRVVLDNRRSTSWDRSSVLQIRRSSPRSRMMTKVKVVVFESAVGRLPEPLDFLANDGSDPASASDGPRGMADVLVR